MGNDRWPPSGRLRTLMTLRETAIALGRRNDLEFERLEDDLGKVWICRRRLPSGSTVELEWRPEGPNYEVSVGVDAEQGELGSLAKEVVRELRLDIGDVTWIPPESLWWFDEPD